MQDTCLSVWAGNERTQTHSINYLQAPFTGLLFGRTEFVFSADAGCGRNVAITLPVVMTTCTDEQFTCQDGFCVSMADRCNKIIDCPRDSSDEDNCQMINFDRTYKKEFAPATIDENKNMLKTNITVSVDLLKILQINEVDSIFSCQLQLNLLWYDQRLSYNNLKMDSNYNALSEDERDKIWTPKIIFSNTEKMDGLINDERAHASVIAKGNYAIASEASVDNAFLYKGLENPITLTRAYKGT